MKLAPQKLCSGCSACAAVCPRAAIHIEADPEGFLRPRIDERRCTACGQCSRVCPVLHPAEPRQPRVVYAAKAYDTELRLASSSGGVFSLLAEQILAKGGLVFGAALDENLVVRHCSASNQEELAPLRGSKYVQSKIGNVFQQVRGALLEKRIVLFSGTPCQVAGLHRYLESVGSWTQELQNLLLLVETVCMAVPSPKAFRRYLDSVRKRFGNDPIHIRFRDKTTGWKSYSLTLDFADGRVCRESHMENPYLRAFLMGLINRPSCEVCSARQLRSGADLTIADYWGVGSRFEEMDDDQGTSLVLVNTPKGEVAFARLSSELEVKISDFAHAKESNPMIVKSPIASPRRYGFLKCLDAQPFETLVASKIQPSLFARLKVQVVNGLKALHLK